MRTDKFPDVTLDVLSSWELSATPLQLRVENFYLGENSDLIQKFQSTADKQSSVPSNCTESSPNSKFPVILGIRSVAQLVMENRPYCIPIISDLGHLKINQSTNNQCQSSVDASPDQLLSNQNLPCYLVEFSTVFTFPVNISQLSLDSKIVLIFQCVDLDVELGQISFQLFSPTGVLRQGRLLVPLGLNRLFDNPRSMDSSASPSPGRGVCSHCAASSRYVSRLGCLTEEFSDSSMSSDSSEIDDDHDYDQPASHAILAMFLDDKKRRRRFDGNQGEKRQKTKSSNADNTNLELEKKEDESNRQEETGKLLEHVNLSDSIKSTVSYYGAPADMSQSDTSSCVIISSAGSISSWSSDSVDSDNKEQQQENSSDNQSGEDQINEEINNPVENNKDERRPEGTETKKENKKIRLRSFRSVSKSVYRAMNCYKLLDLINRGVVKKCYYTNNFCRSQIQLQCMRNLHKALNYFGFISLSLPIFPSPVLYSTTPPQQTIETEDQQIEQQAVMNSVSSLPSWLGGSSPYETNNKPEQSSPKQRPRIKRSMYSYVPIHVLLNRRSSSVTASNQEIDNEENPSIENQEVNLDGQIDNLNYMRSESSNHVDDSVQWYLDACDKTTSIEYRESLLSISQNIRKENQDGDRNFHARIKKSISERPFTILVQDQQNKYKQITTSTQSSPGVQSKFQQRSVTDGGHNRLMRIIEECSKHTDFYYFYPSNPVESLDLKQQRQLAIAAMDRRRDFDSEEGNMGFRASTLPQVSEYPLVDATLSLTSFTPSDKRLLWRHRKSLQCRNISVLKLAAAVDWTSVQQPQEFNEMLETWQLPTIENTLELLSSLSLIPTVRQFACRALAAASDDDICRYLPQLVQAVRYDVPGPNALVLSALIRRATESPLIASTLHWALQCESEDPEKGHLFIRGQQRLLESLSKIESPRGFKILKILELQRKFAKALRNLASIIRERKDRADRKTERLRELLTAPATDSGFQLSNNFQEAIPLPIAPYGLLLGIVAEKSHVVRSSQYPFVLACRVLIPPPNNNENYYDDALWGEDKINVDELKEKGYKEILKKYLYKTGDDLRQDQLVTSIFKIMKSLLLDYGCDYCLTLYEVLPFSRNDGVVEFIDNCEPLSSIKKTYPTLRHYFAAYSTESDSGAGFPRSVLNNFIRSCSGYSVITFLLGVGDRHLDNLLLSEDGRFFHVDFGFILGDDPKPFPPPMKLCSEMIEGLGGLGSEGYTTFQLMCCQCFRCIRRHSELILHVLLLMAHSGIKCLKSDPFNTIARVQEKFQLDLSEVEAEAVLLDIIGVSANALFPAVVDKFHEWSLYWK